MRLVIFIIASFIAYSSQAQLGLNFRYGNLNPIPWEEQSNVDPLFNSNLEFGLDYWLRLKNYRVEFMPELFYSKSETSINTATYNSQAFGVAVNTNFYIFDFEGDCDCPTFSKDGNFFSKGFFLSASPSLEYVSRDFEDDSEAMASDKNINIGISIGAGLDIGILDLITISPYIKYKFIPATKWDGFQQAHNNLDPDEIIRLSYPQIGLRIGFRPDYVREQNKYRRR